MERDDEASEAAMVQKKGHKSWRQAKKDVGWVKICWGNVLIMRKTSAIAHKSKKKSHTYATAPTYPSSFPYPSQRRLILFRRNFSGDYAMHTSLSYTRVIYDARSGGGNPVSP